MPANALAELFPFLPHGYRKAAIMMLAIFAGPAAFGPVVAQVLSNLLIDKIIVRVQYACIFGCLRGIEILPDAGEKIKLLFLTIRSFVFS